MPSPIVSADSELVSLQNEAERRHECRWVMNTDTCPAIVDAFPGLL